MIAAVVGSRTFTNYQMMITVLLNKGIKKIVSGGARGADKLAERFANEHGIPIEIIKPDWKKNGKAAGLIRNKDIVNKADVVFAFWDGQSKGTKHSIDLARKAGKVVEIISFATQGE